MARRNRYLLVYDIRDDRRLRRVHRVARAFGDPLQYSVFVCDLTDAERARLRMAIHPEISHDVDSVAVFDLGPAAGRGIECVDYLGTSREVGDDGPRIW